MTMSKQFSVKSGKREHVENTRAAIRNLEEFKTRGGLLGTGANWHGSGKLSGPDLKQWERDVNDIDYVVYSYSTPIAWHVAELPPGTGRWYGVSQRFSQTTSTHQSVVAYALTETPKRPQPEREA
jgi:hypothetical protein